MLETPTSRCALGPLPPCMCPLHVPLAAMQEAVWGAVQGCQYDDPLKKERLCSAVMEALSGQKTMKAAAATHEVNPAVLSREATSSTPLIGAHS